MKSYFKNCLYFVFVFCFAFLHSKKDVPTPQLETGPCLEQTLGFHLYKSLPSKSVEGGNGVLLFSSSPHPGGLKSKWVLGRGVLVAALFCSVNMELYDNHKTANIVSPLHTHGGWEVINYLKEAFSLPRKYKYICFDLISLIFKESYALFMSVHRKCRFSIFSSISLPPRTILLSHKQYIFSSESFFCDCCSTSTGSCVI